LEVVQTSSFPCAKIFAKILNSLIIGLAIAPIIHVSVQLACGSAVIFTTFVTELAFTRRRFLW
jgi:hypothetical protein